MSSGHTLFPESELKKILHSNKYQVLWKHAILITLMCWSIGTPKNNKFFICSKWKIYYFQVSQNLGRVQPHYNLFEYWDT